MSCEQLCGQSIVSGTARLRSLQSSTPSHTARNSPASVLIGISDATSLSACSVLLICSVKAAVSSSEYEWRPPAVPLTSWIVELYCAAALARR
ncbi:hypothetical protein GN244_ATG03062 [Phytophthora infestans]|uniref:Uncharacterized protein n=1 Tax=Phytophthora infestans TaxID=4787 RepID=A0A833WNY9_PHYIN|nr:hypothetical protein GN244_ATG03062 [Phytophthora infestans]